MTKVLTLLLLRHAKSDWNSGAGNDHDRPLSRRGREAASAMGRFMKHSRLIPDLCLTSTAARAAETLARAARAGGWEQVPVEPARMLYGAGPAEVVGVLASLPEGAERVLLVGHEPGWSETVSVLTGGSSIRMATGTLARIDFEAERWSDCRPGTGVLTGLFPPRLMTPVLGEGV